MHRPRVLDAADIDDAVASMEIVRRSAAAYNSAGPRELRSHGLVSQPAKRPIPLRTLLQGNVNDEALLRSLYRRRLQRVGEVYLNVCRLRGHLSFLKRNYLHRGSIARRVHGDEHEAVMRTVVGGPALV